LIKGASSEKGYQYIVKKYIIFYNCGMYRRRPFFLLEIVIAIAVVGLFAFGFLWSGMRYLSQERKALLNMEYERQRNLKRMEVIASHWEALLSTQEKKEDSTCMLEATVGGKKYTTPYSYKVESHAIGKDYELVLVEGRKRYHFLVTKK
jgi:hypothetical protein